MTAPQTMEPSGLAYSGLVGESVGTLKKARSTLIDCRAIRRKGNKDKSRINTEISILNGSSLLSELDSYLSSASIISFKSYALLKAYPAGFGQLQKQPEISQPKNQYRVNSNARNHPRHTFLIAPIPALFNVGNLHRSPNPPSYPILPRGENTKTPKNLTRSKPLAIPSIKIQTYPGTPYLSSLFEMIDNKITTKTKQPQTVRVSVNKNSPIANSNFN